MFSEPCPEVTSDTCFLLGTSCESPATETSANQLHKKSLCMLNETSKNLRGQFCDILDDCDLNPGSWPLPLEAFCSRKEAQAQAKCTLACAPVLTAISLNSAPVLDSSGISNSAWNDFIWKHKTHKFYFKGRPKG